MKPSALRAPIVRPICCMMTGAKPSVGSSSSNSRAPVRRIRAIASICCSPPESLVPWLPSRSRKFGNSAKMPSRSRPPARTCRGSSRFSLTSSVAKMPRSSGQNAIPDRAITSEGSRISSLPSNSTDPERFSMIPMMALSVVVLPTPLRPRSVTTSPGRTAKVTPCRMCDSPYQALSWFTVSRSRVSGMTGPEIGFAHRRIVGDRFVVALGQHVAAGEHGDAIA